MKDKYTLSWKKPPSYSVLRNIIITLPENDLEDAFRKFTRKLLNIPSDEIANYSLDGKVLRGSFDHFNKKSAIQLLSVFAQIVI